MSLRTFTSILDVPHLKTSARRIYLASSWRNPYQPDLLARLRAAGHEVYDFRNPEPGDDGFSWSDTGCDEHASTIPDYLKAMESPVAEHGFRLDYRAMCWADTFVMALPCGRSAHLEAGWACGKGKPVIWWLHPDKWEPELMYLLGNAFVVEDGW